MLSSGILAILGFLFWIINARLYSTEQVGIGTTLISVMALISSFSILGLDKGLIRYLPGSKRKNEKINTSFTIVSLMSILISVIYLIFLKSFSPKLLFVRENIIFLSMFIVFIVFSSLDIISENIFIAYRSSKYVLFKNIIFSSVKLIAPFILIALGAYGIFMSVGIALGISFGFSLFFLIFKYNYSYRPIMNSSVLKKMTKFSLGNYTAGFLYGLPAMILPVLIINKIGPRNAAYFYMGMMIASFIFVAPITISQALLAEGSHNESALKIHLKKAVRIISIIIIPAIIITVFLGKYILLAFGKDYSTEGLKFLRLLALSGIFVSINYLSGTVLRVKHKIKALISINLFSAILILGLSYLLLTRGLLGIGFAWIIGQGLVSLIYLGVITNKRFIQF
ncbi:MAG: oligosaccharide flippase family protein [Actinomycetia bacterium]|nr:oligosaccharide flippase family protein [Actinomycetes bacterium]